MLSKNKAEIKGFYGEGKQREFVSTNGARASGHLWAEEMNGEQTLPYKQMNLKPITDPEVGRKTIKLVEKHTEENLRDPGQTKHRRLHTKCLIHKRRNDRNGPHENQNLLLYVRRSCEDKISYGVGTI